jgi:hypothetical protein
MGLRSQDGFDADQVLPVVREIIFVNKAFESILLFNLPRFFPLSICLSF